MVAIAPEKTLATLTVSAIGKLNVTLSVLGPRDDGFHDIDSLVVGVGLYDTLVARATEDGTIGVLCADSALETPDNLVVRAATLLRDEYAVAQGIAFELHKSIPVGGGMGGGSSDCAAALRLCNDLWSLGLSNDRLAEHGVGLGSDVPLFFALPSAAITGRGERVAPVRLAWSGWAVLCSVRCIVPTADVYRAWCPAANRTNPGQRTATVLSATSADAIMELTLNELEPAVFDVAPAVRKAFDAIEALDVGSFRVSGAGSTLFRFYNDEATARSAARFIEEEISSLTTQVVAAPVGVCPIRTKE